MELVPTQDEVLALLRENGALQNRHFEWLNGLHTDINLEAALAMRYHRNAKTLSVGLSRKLRANSELRALIPELSIVSEIGRAHAELQSLRHLVCRLLLEKKK